MIRVAVRPVEERMNLCAYVGADLVGDDGLEV